MTVWFKRTFAAVTLAAAPGIASAEDPQVRASRRGDEVVVTLQTGTLKVAQYITKDAVRFELVDGSDMLGVTANLAGQVSIRRGGRRHDFSMRTPTDNDRAVVVTMVSGSPARGRFDRVMRSRWAQASRSAEAFRSGHALLGLLAGDYEPSVRRARSLVAPAASLMSVRQEGPDACWSAYARDVLKYTYDLEACVAEAADSWLPWHLAWCAYEYDIKASLALWWMLDCYGLP